MDEMLESTKRLEPEQMLKLMKPIIWKVAEEHKRGCVFGYIRPENIVIRDKAWFCFSLSTDLQGSFWEEWKETGHYIILAEAASIGKSLDEKDKAYMPLEQYLDDGSVRPGSDVYSLCAVMYRGITGKAPTNAKSRMDGAVLRKPSELGIWIDKKLEETLMKGLALLRRDRYLNAEELYKVLYQEVVLDTKKDDISKEEDVPAGEEFDYEYDFDEYEEGYRKVTEKSDIGTPKVFEKKTGGLKWKKYIITGVVFFILILTGVILGNARKDSQTFREEKDFSQNILRNNEVDEELGEAQLEKTYMLGTDIKRREIISVIFLNTLDGAPDNRWDISANENGSVIAWVEENGEGYDFYIAGDGGVVGNSDCKYLFGYCTNLKEIYFNDCFDTSQVTDMCSMFYGCSSLTVLDVGSFNTAQVTDMSLMFDMCGNLTDLDVSNFDTARVVNMCGMFYGCSGLRELNVSGFNTMQVTDMSLMFTSCSNLIELNVSGFNTAQVTDMRYMFYDCGGLRELNVSCFNTAKVTNMECMFKDCGGLKELDVRNFDTAQVTNMSYMFCDCCVLRELQLSGFDTTQVTNMNSMFWGCISLAELDISNFKTSQVTDMGLMFTDCSSLRGLDVRGFDTSRVTVMRSMFYGCSGLRELNVSGFDTSHVTDMGFMFTVCSSLKELDVSKFNTSQVTDMSYMFYGCSSLMKLEVNGFDTSRVMNMAHMFEDCSGLEELDISGLDMSSVYDNTNMLKGTLWE